GTDGAASDAATAALIERGRNLSGDEMVGAGVGSAAFDVEQRVFVGGADASRDRGEPALSGPAGVDAIRAEICIVQIAPGTVGLHAEHESSQLIIHADLAADHYGIARRRRRTGDERPVAVGETGPDVSADIKAGPIVGSREGNRAC